MVEKSKLFGAPFLGIAALLMVLTATSALGAELVKADVPFGFMVGSKALPAGGYEFQIDRANASVAILSTAKGKVSSALAPIITTLAAPAHSSVDHAHIVFDKLGSTYTLSEIWREGTEGLLVHSTKGPHEHHVLHTQK